MTADQPPNRDVDVASYLGAITRHWWLILALVAVGVAAGLVLTLVQPDMYDATSSVYIGQTTDANGSPMAGLNSNAKAAIQLLSSQDVLDDAAEQTGGGMTASRLGRETTVETPSSTVKTTTSVVNIVVITVADGSPKRAAIAANALARTLLTRIADPVDAKIDLLEKQVSDLTEKRDRALETGRFVERELNAIARSGMSSAEKAAASAPYVAVAQSAAVQADSLTSSLQRAELMLLTAKNVEQPRILHEAAVPDVPSGPDVRLNVAAGALAGLVIGIVAAFVRQRRVARAG